MRPQNLSPRALRDIEQAADDIAASAAGPAFADRFAVAVADAAERAARRPLLGHRRLDLLPGRFRFRAVKGFPYLLVYNAEHPDWHCHVNIGRAAWDQSDDVAPIMRRAGRSSPAAK